MQPSNLRDRKSRSPATRLNKLAERASNAPQGMRARKTEAAILEKMPLDVWFTCTSVSRVIGASDDRKTRARLDRLVRNGKMERKREQGTHGSAYFYRRLP
jgi:hypothetical protein